MNGAPQPAADSADFASLYGHTALVTGGSQGIGRAIAIELARAGAEIVVHCRRSEEAAQAVAAECRTFGNRSDVLLADLSVAENLAGFVDAAWKVLNAPSIWINNAGVDLLTGPNSKAPYAAKLQQLLDIDVRSTILLSRDVGNRLRAANGGVILNIGWDQADRGMEGDSGELFAAAKNAIMGFTRSLAVSLAPKVRVNCIAPGWIRTSWGTQAGPKWQERVLQETPLCRWGEPEDVACVARFLVSREAGFVTGQVINVNGGAVR